MAGGRARKPSGIEGPQKAFLAGMLVYKCPKTALSWRVYAFGVS